MIISRAILYGNSTLVCTLEYSSFRDFFNSISNCMYEAINPSLPLIYNLIATNLAFGILVDIFGHLSNRNMAYFTSTFGGFLLMYLFTPPVWQSVYVLGSIFLFIACLVLSHSAEATLEIEASVCVKIFVSVWIFAGNLILGEKMFVKVRHVLVSAAMKVIALSTDCECYSSLYNTEAIFGFLMCPALFLYGPYMSFENFRNDLTIRKRDYLAWIWVICTKFGWAFFIIFVSQCLVEVFIPRGLSLYVDIWKEGFQYRMQYYYIATILEIGVVSAGFQTYNHIMCPYDWGFMVANIYNIELASTLISSFVHWDCASIIFYLQCNGIHTNIFLLTAIFMVISVVFYADVGAVAFVLLFGITATIQVEFCGMFESVLGVCLSKTVCAPCPHQFKKYSVVTRCFNLFSVFLNSWLLTYFCLPYSKWELVYLEFRWGLYIMGFVIIALSFHDSLNRNVMLVFR